MDTAAWRGLVLGVVAGGGYAWLQLRSLQRADQARRQGAKPAWSFQLSAASGRLLLVGAVLVVALTSPPEKINKWWLTGGLVVSYSVPLFWRLKHLFSDKQ